MIDQREVRYCDYCRSPFHPVRELQRFCCHVCHDLYYPLERKQALAAWRAQQRMQQAAKFFSPPEDDQIRKVG